MSESTGVIDRTGDKIVDTAHHTKESAQNAAHTTADKTRELGHKASDKMHEATAAAKKKIEEHRDAEGKPFKEKLSEEADVAAAKAHGGHGYEGMGARGMHKAEVLGDSPLHAPDRMDEEHKKEDKPFTEKAADAASIAKEQAQATATNVADGAAHQWNRAKETLADAMQRTREAIMGPERDTVDVEPPKSLDKGHFLHEGIEPDRTAVAAQKMNEAGVLLDSEPRHIEDEPKPGIADSVKHAASTAACKVSDTTVAAKDAVVHAGHSAMEMTSHALTAAKEKVVETGTKVKEAVVGSERKGTIPDVPEHGTAFDKPVDKTEDPGHAAKATQATSPFA